MPGQANVLAHVGEEPHKQGEPLVRHRIPAAKLMSSSGYPVDQQRSPSLDSAPQAGDNELRVHA